MKCVVLHVEDDPNDLFFTAKAFKKVAPQVHLIQIDDGEKAVSYLSGTGDYADAAKHPRPHMVLLDLKLPRRSGLEILEWMRKIESLRDIPAVILSSSKDPSDVERANGLGVSTYLVKSSDIQLMREMLRGVADLAARHVALHQQG